MWQLALESVQSWCVYLVELIIKCRHWDFLQTFSCVLCFLSCDLQHDAQFCSTVRVPSLWVKISSSQLLSSASLSFGWDTWSVSDHRLEHEFKLQGNTQAVNWDFKIKMDLWGIYNIKHRISSDYSCLEFSRSCLHQNRASSAAPVLTRSHEEAEILTSPFDDWPDPRSP